MYGRWCYLCGEVATQVDHIRPGDNHDVNNLAPICEDCHKAKTLDERNNRRFT